jgi:hypothetical protein
MERSAKVPAESDKDAELTAVRRHHHQQEELGTPDIKAK